MAVDPVRDALPPFREVVDRIKQDVAGACGGVRRELFSGELRIRRGSFSLEDVAIIAGVSVAYLSGLERGEYPVRDPQTLLRVLDVYADLPMYISSNDARELGLRGPLRIEDVGDLGRRVEALGERGRSGGAGVDEVPPAEDPGPDDPPAA